MIFLIVLRIQYEPMGHPSGTAFFLWQEMRFSSLMWGQGVFLVVFRRQSDIVRGPKILQRRFLMMIARTII
jgi:hypothetical protein